MYQVLLVAHTLVVLFLIGMILLQRTDSDGLGGLGGGGGNQFMTGRSAANFMTRTTAILGAAFMITSLTLAVIANRGSEGSIIDSAPAAITDKAPVADKAAATPAKTETKPAAPAVPKPE